MSDLAGLRHATINDLESLVALQHAAYGPNRAILGVEPIPLQTDYAEVFRDREVWVADGEKGIEGALILKRRPDDLLIWSVATLPSVHGKGVGRRLLSAAEERARQLRKPTIRLYTGQRLTTNVAWYSRHGYEVERTEQLPDRLLIHMIKSDF